MNPRILAVIDATPVISLDEAKNFLRVDETADDALITRQIEAATCACERYTELSFRRKQLEWSYYRGYPTEYCRGEVNRLELPDGPNQVIESVTRINGVEENLLEATTDYQIHGRGFLTVSTGSSYRLSQGRIDGEIRVVYTAGFDEDEPLPEDCKEAVLKVLAELYDKRESSITGTIVATLDLNHKALLKPYRRTTLF